MNKIIRIVHIMSHYNSLLLPQMDSDFLSYMIEQELEPGDRIPPLSQLSGELNISISKLREQLEVARSMGLVEVRPRTGIRCTEFDFMHVLRIILFFTLARNPKNFDLYSSLRVHVEAAYWKEATALLTDEDKAHLKTLVARAWTKLRGERITIPHLEHRNFHMGIFKRLNNPFVKGILETYWEAYEAVELNRYADYAYLARVWTFHERIAHEIEAGNYQASLEAFIEHTQLLRHQPMLDTQFAFPDGYTPSAIDNHKLKGSD